MYGTSKSCYVVIGAEMTYKTYCDFHGCNRIETEDERFINLSVSFGRDDYRSWDLCSEHIKAVIDFIEEEK